ncbi:hypothetical protein BKA62DRAFT_35058 [Auriculariales sp. MPI-PUGE-AT-0066]|nr:hypothetical protein BKA62DRAFT_35058 [Auriculariales sp. MPI-PUGE-AT-0066]
MRPQLPTIAFGSTKLQQNSQVPASTLDLDFRCPLPTMIAGDDFPRDALSTPEFRALDLAALDRQLVALALDDVEEVTASRKGTFQEQEALAARDHALAEALSRGIPLPTTAPQSGARTPARHSALQSPTVRSSLASPVTSPFSSRRASISQAFVSNGHTYRSVAPAFGFRAPNIDEANDDKAGSSSRVECVACTSRIRPGARSLRAPCDHVYDAACIEDLFKTSLTDETLFPPRCCKQEISLESVRHLISATLRFRFESKSLELRTLRRVYCSRPTCSRFLGAQTDNPANLICPQCFTATCSACNAIHAAGMTCAQNADGLAVAEVAAANGWQRCPGCRRMIELDMGCYHMTCFCRTQFCYLCAAPWKTCGCAQWEENRLVAVAREQVANAAPVGRRVQPNAAEQRVRIEEAVERLRVNHDCDHQRTWFRRGTDFQCGLCHWHADQYILQCSDCNTRLCKRCKHNRVW